MTNMDLGNLHLTNLPKQCTGGWTAEVTQLWFPNYCTTNFLQVISKCKCIPQLLLTLPNSTNSWYLTQYISISIKIPLSTMFSDKQVWDRNPAEQTSGWYLLNFSKSSNCCKEWGFVSPPYLCLFRFNTFGSINNTKIKTSIKTSEHTALRKVTQQKYPANNKTLTTFGKQHIKYGQC